MAEDMSIQTANTMMQMIASRGSLELDTRIMKMQVQQDQAVVAMLADQAALLKSAGYNGNGASVPPVAQGSVDTSA